MRLWSGGSEAPLSSFGIFAALVAIFVAVLVPAAGAADLGSAQLLIAGTELTVSPESQTVPFNTPTIVDTQLSGYDPLQGTLPDDLRVLADFTGPEVDGVLVLETRPNQPFRIPRLSLKGEYVLDNIRLVQGEGDDAELLTYASPRSALVLVTQVLVTQVTSRALSLDEIRSYGIVVNDDNFRAFNFTFGFAVDGEVYDYNVPVVYSAEFGDIYGNGDNPVLLPMEMVSPSRPVGGTGAPRFKPPQMAPFVLENAPSGGGSTWRQSGGCQSAFGCDGEEKISLPGVILFPTDVGLLNQFFSVVLVAKNDAPAGDSLVIRDLTAKVTLPPGLRMAQTEPATPLGVPVPVRVPGPDGQVGTGDDITFLIAQSTGEAEVLVEGRKEGTHVVRFDLEGVLDGLASGEIQRITGSAQGAVVVRDPTLGVTISHPDAVRVGEDYKLRLTVSNTSNAPVNLVTVELPASKLSGVSVVGTSEKTIPTLPPGESELVDFTLRPTRTGRVVASSVRSPYFVDPRFELTVAVGELGIPLSPDAIVLPELAGELPAAVVDEALSLVGLAFSLAEAPVDSLSSELPRMDLNAVDGLVYRLAQAGRHVRLGEETFDALAVLAAEWGGAGSDGADWEWDRLRRSTDKGGRFADAVAATFATEATATSPLATFERFAETTAYLGELDGALAVGGGARVELASRTSGLAVARDGLDPARVRDLPFADLYDLGGAEMAWVAMPEAGGYQVRLTHPGGGSSDLHLLVPDDAGDLRRVSWYGVSLGAGGLALADFTHADTSFTLFVDADGDGLVDQQPAGAVSSLAPRAFDAVAAVQRQTASGHAVEVLFSQEVDLTTLQPRDPQRFELPGNLSNGGLVPFEADLAAFNWVIAENKFAGLRNSRVVEVLFSNPVSPYQSHTLTVRDVVAVTGDAIAQTTLPVTTTVTEVGGSVEGTVIGPDGQPVPFARVEVFETDARWQDGLCVRHRTAATTADVAGQYRFDYVRQTSCSDVFILRGTDPQTGSSGQAIGRIRFAGQPHAVDVVMLGRGTIRGRVRYDDGTVPEEISAVAYSPVFTTGVQATIFPDGTYEAREVPVGTVSLYAGDFLGNFVYQTVEIPTAGAVVERDLTILRRPSEEATGELRGTVYETDGVTPAYNAYLALYANGELVGVQRTAFDGTFDFGVVPAGLAEIEGFDGETGLSGVNVTFEVLPDQVNDVNLLLADERGEVEGHVYRQTAQGLVPVEGAVVWVDGTPFNTVTDEAGYYHLDGVFAGTKQVTAADLASGEQVSETVTVTDGALAYRDLHFIEDFGDGGIVGEVLGFTGNPVPFARVHIGSGERHWWHESLTDTRGRFSIPDLRPGTYELHAVVGDEAGGNAVGTRETVVIQYEGATPFVSMRFKKGTIRGRTVILDELGQQVSVTSLVTYRTTAINEGLVTLDWSSKTLETDGDGWFEITDVLAGPYALSVSNAFHGTQSVQGSLVFHGDVAEHEIVFEQNGSISGTVLDVDGVTPVAGAVVHLRHPDLSAYDLVSDEEGRFSFELVPPGGRFPIDVEVDQGAIFRKTRVWVHYNEHGQQMDIDVVLRPQGTVNGWVEDAGGLPVAGATVTLREHAWPNRTLTQTADGEGYYSFTNVFAGRLSIEAQAPQLGGLGGKTLVPLSTEGEEVWSLIVLEGAGEIYGQVFSPVDGQPVPSAQVTLHELGGSVIDGVTADSEGGFRFRLLPLGLYRVWVFDPTTGRHGALDMVEITVNGEVVAADVTLEVRGEVDGHVYDPDGDLPIPGGTVQLSTDSLVHLVTYASTDTDGFYEFLGIPEGDFTLRVREPGGRRDAQGEGVISEEGERVTVDLRFQEVGTVTGTVWNPPGAPAGAFANVNTVIRENGRVVGASLDNPFTFEGLVVGRDLRIEAYEIGGNHRGLASGKIVDAANVETIDVTMVPIGSVTVSVEDSFGAPVAGADLNLTSSGFYGRRLFIGSTGGDGTATFNGVGEGWLGAFVTNPVNGLRGSETGTLSLEGEQVQIAVTLEDAGSISGRLLLADGVTPATDALVVVTVGGRTYQLRADLDGSFAFPSLPLGGWSLFAEEYFGDAASLELSGTLATNGEAIALGDLVLDDADPEVLVLSPASGSRDLALTTAVTVDFSEPIDKSRFSGSWFTFRKLSGAGVSYSVVWSNGDATATLVPNGSLANFTGYEVIVNQAYDVAGRDLKEKIKTTFFTVDQVAPTVIDVLPRNGAVQVPVDDNLRITFSEPVVLSSLSGSALQLTDVATGQQVTTTWQLLADERLAIITPQTALATDATYQLLVQNVLDGSGNAMAPLVVTTFKTPDTIAPTIDSVSFPSGTSFTSGDDVPVTVTASDATGVAKVIVHAGEWSFEDAASPWSLTALAPVVAAAGDVTLTVEAIDVYGNSGTTTRTIQVAPYANATVPSVDTLCGLADHLVLPGIETELAFVAGDDERLERLRILIDGAEVARSPLVLSAGSELSYVWTPPAGAVAGDLFAVRFEARDFAGNVTTHDLTARVPDGTVLVGARSLFDDYAGQDVVLAEGTFLVREPMTLGSLTLVRGAAITNGDGYLDLDVTTAGDLELHCGADVTPTLRDADGPVVRLTAGAEMAIESGATVSARAHGYDGGHSGHLDGYVPAGVAPSLSDGGGGSHGGRGGTSDDDGVGGEVYGSIQRPSLAGGGGAADPWAAGSSSGIYPGERGGGVLLLTADTLTLDGLLRVDSNECYAGGGGGGAGGSVLVEATTLRGDGRIDASGAQRWPTECNSNAGDGAGGGGRVALHAATFDGFDPAAQVDVAGGKGFVDWGAPGTLFWKQAGDLHGRLRIDQGSSLAEKVGVTELPVLGTGAVSLVESEGADAWVTGGAAFMPRWVGAWMVLVDGGGGDLGAFEVTDLDAGGRLRLAGAVGVSGAATYRGEYRFDAVELAGGAGLSATDPVIVDEVDLGESSSISGPISVGTLEVVDGTVGIGGGLVAENAVVRSGAVLGAPAGNPSTLRLEVTGTLTVEAGAKIDGSGSGYLGGRPTGTRIGDAPPWVAGSTYNSGGSHGGRGVGNNNNTGTPGEVYGSVYSPRLPGGGGSAQGTESCHLLGLSGGAAIEIAAGTLVLEGDVISGSLPDCGTPLGAGGSILLDVGTLSGGGSIDASGGDASYSGCSNRNAGGGGRVAIYADLLDGFDPAAQVRAWGGAAWNFDYAAPGTVYVKLPADTYGELRVDAGQTSGGADREAWVQTELPELGAGAVTMVEVAGADAWVTGGTPFYERWVGAWMALADGSGGDLGSFQVAEVDAGGGRARLEGAAAATAAAIYAGEYRFDRVEILHGAGLHSASPLVADEVETVGDGLLSGDVRVSNLTVSEGRSEVADPLVLQQLTLAAGAVLAPAAGQPLRLDVSGTLTVEAGAKIDGTGGGFAGGTYSGPGMAPAWVVGSTYESGGSHGGRGAPDYGGGEPGEEYGSVYRPRLGGGGGSAPPLTGPTPGLAGGAAVEVTAGTLVLEGEIVSGSVKEECAEPEGAGGSILLDVGTLSGAGSIDASGGDGWYTTPSSCSSDTAGGGGRVAIWVDQLVGFDPATQARAWGGRSYFMGYAAPGTVYVHLPTDTHGTLRIDAGQTTGGADRVAWVQTALPELGTGSVTLVEVAGADAWVTGDSPFYERWVGAWMKLADGGGADLGTFRVAEVDAGGGRARLEGAAAVSAAASHAGEYRFDRVEVLHGAGLHSATTLLTDELETLGSGTVSGDVQIAEVVLSGGVVEVSPDFSAQNLRIAAGTTVVPVPGQPLVLEVPGTLTVEAGAKIDGSGGGFAGGTYSGPGMAPAWVVGSTYESGGSHGGRGAPDYGGGEPGEEYGSVYRPRLGGGGGSAPPLTGPTPGLAGGAAVEVTAGTLVLEGEIVSGSVKEECAEPEGAGGSILIDVGTLSGAGSIDASGGDGWYTTPSSCSSDTAGGGGRVAIWVDQLVGFDPATQTRAWGGRSYFMGYAAPGTVFVHQPADTHGTLRIDAGQTTGGADRVPWVETSLPQLGSGSVTLVEVSGADAWVTGGVPFYERWVGAWMKLADGAGGDLGGFRVAEVDAGGGRARLEGAAAATAAASYAGEYRFDRVEVAHGAKLGDLVDEFAIAEMVIAGGTAELGTVEVTDLTVAAGAVLKPRGTEPLHVIAGGTVTVESGGTIDADGRGYADGYYPSHLDGFAPDGVTPSVGTSGGSHGGRGQHGSGDNSDLAGEVYDSVYQPELGGGGGGYVQYGSRDGGGVVRIEAANVTVDGVVRANGQCCDKGGGGGGTVRITAGTLAGLGSIAAEGGSQTNSSTSLGSGGGGRIALDVTTFSGFDPLTQASAVGGPLTASNEHGAPGTIFHRRAGDLYGRLLVDQRTATGSVAETTLPAIGRGFVGVAEADAVDASDLWIEPQDPNALFSLGVVGMWMRVAGVDHAVIGQSADRRRVLLDGAAGAVAVGDAYVGVYKLDQLQVDGLARLESVDGLVVSGSTTVGSGSSIAAADLDPPVVLFTAPATGTTVSSGTSVTMAVNVTDASAVTQVEFVFGGGSVIDTEAPWEATLPAPVVTEEGPVDVVVTATDAEGNLGTATRPVTVQPLAAGDPPAVSFVCPTPGARLAAGSGLDVTVDASHDDGIEKVDFRLDDDPTVLATDTAAPYQFRFTVPAGAVEGDTVTFRAEARSFNGNSAETTYVATVVGGTLVGADTFLAAGDASFDGTSVIVSGGTLTVEGAHTFRDLVVLDGAAVSHPAGESLDLSLTRDLYVACGGAVDASGRGWPTEVIETGFTGGDLSDWTVFDVPGSTSAPSDWQIDTSGSGYLRQWSDIYYPDTERVGTFLTWDPGTALTDYRFAVRQRSDDDDGIGLVFRYQDDGNHYRFYWHNASIRRLQKRVGGSYVTLAEDSVGYTKFAWYEIEIVAEGPRLQAWVDGALIFDVIDGEYAAGTFGLMAYGNVNSIWDDLRVTALGGAIRDLGGSHGGRAGGFDGDGRVYGSLFDPDLPGAGGEGRTGTVGGGVLRLAVGGDAIVDGLVAASGASESGSEPLGAGGSIRLDAAAIRGAGSIDASGGGSTAARPAGSGGRIALYAASVDAGLLSRTLAAGGEASTAALTGAAGTLYVKRDAQPFGELVIDNAGRVSDHYTELVSVPPGTVDTLGVPAGGVDTMTDADASFPSSLVGAELSVAGSTGGPWPIVGHDDLGDTLSVDVSAAALDAVPGDAYEVIYRFDDVTVRGGAKTLTLATVQSTQAPDVEAGSSWQSSYAPSISLIAPADGASYTSGTAIAFAASVDDDLGVAAATLTVGGESYVDAVPPFSWTVAAPIVASATPLPVTVSATDLSGHPLEHSITLQVNPSSDPTAPVASLGGCPAEGDLVLAGVPVDLDFTVTDVEKLYAWRVKVDGVVVDEAIGIDTTSATGLVTWSPPAGDPAGTVYAVAVEAQDYGGNLTAAVRTLRLPAGPVLSASQNVDGSYAGQHLTLAAGTYTFTAPQQLASLSLLDGAVATHPAGGSLVVEAVEDVRVQCGATIEASGLGYAGGTSSTPPGAPAGIALPADDGGGSHGGVSWAWHGSAGEVYDSVYLPRLAGGGGALDNDGSGDGHAGGGIVELTAAELVLAGDVRAHGVNSNDQGRAGSAGGSILLRAGTLSGGGLIQASGGYMRYCSTSRAVGSGGGGRIAIHADQLVGFDPATQITAVGGTQYYCNWTYPRFGGPGTIFVKTAASTYGDLWIDNGEASDGTPRTPTLPTPLPSLGGGAVSAVEVSGSDLWVTGAAPFRERWLGAWMTLDDGAGGDLGGYQAIDLDGGGRLLLAGAATASAAAGYAGEYRFDRVTLDDTGGISATDPVIVADLQAFDASWIEGPIETPYLEIGDGYGVTQWSDDVRATDVTVRSGAVVQPTAASGFLRMEVPGTLTVEAGATIDVSGLGYAGATASTPPGAPPGIALPANDGGGSHGGVSWPWHGSAGEVYDSVYLPRLPGGGGSLDDDGSGDGHPGGGVIELDVGTLVIDGDVLAHGVNSNDQGRPASAGGSIVVRAGTLSGSGFIRASGGYMRYCSTSRAVGAGGGGRIALHVDQLLGFDPASQATVAGGVQYYCNWTYPRFGGPGTVYLKTATSTYGELRIDNEEVSNGNPRTPTLPTPLPSLGGGAVTAVEVAGTDLWVSGGSAFRERWLGAWMALDDGAGGDLGSFEVLDLDAGGRLLLAGAASAAGAAGYAGEYRFDKVTLDDTGGISATDPVIVADLQAFDASWIEGPIETPYLEIGDGYASTFWSPDVRATDVTVRAGAVVQPATADGVLRIEAPGTLTVESGASLNANRFGYLGGVSGSPDGGAPAGLTGPTSDAGGSHGGAGRARNAGAVPGEVYDSVYVPTLPGGGAALDDDGSGDGGRGAGVVEIVAGVVVLDGQIWVHGGDESDTGSSAAAGGTVRIEAGSLSGAGTIYAHGGYNRYCSSSRAAGGGGGGRIALWVDQITGFDPPSQAYVYGGGLTNCSSNSTTYASAGTLFVHTATSTYGDLWIDNGTTYGRTPTEATQLPLLGGGTVTAAEVSAADLWVTGPAVFRERWLGAWMALDDGAGGDLGTYRVSEIDGTGRALLAGAAAAASAAGYQGVYLFDQVTLDDGAGLETLDPLSAAHVEVVDGSALAGPVATPFMEIFAGTSPTLWSPQLQPVDLTVRANAVVQPAASESGVLRIELPGTLVVENGASLDVNYAGHAGGVSGTPDGGAPAGVSASTSDSGGSHGGVGKPRAAGGVPGEVYDSVYYPTLPGGGGALDDDGTGNGGAGAGVVEIVAGDVVLDGTIWAWGGDKNDSDSAGGAGGTVRIEAATLTGAGWIRAHGGYNRYCSSSRANGAGGGGRIALLVDAISGFVPIDQTFVLGGALYDCSWNKQGYGGVGTLFVRTSGSIHGDLYLDSGLSNGQPRKFAETTPLPLIGTGVVGTTTVDGADPSDLWIEPQDVNQTFAFGVVGAWVRIGGNDYPILDQSADRRQLLLDGGAGIVSTGDPFAGVYKFDTVTVWRGAVLELLDITEVGSYDVDADSQLITP